MTAMDVPIKNAVRTSIAVFVHRFIMSLTERSSDGNLPPQWRL